RNIKIREGMMASLSGNLASMCPAVPYAIAAKFAFPDRVPIAFVGDGAMQMLCMKELITISKDGRDWVEPRLVIVVLNNSDHNMVTGEQRILAGEPKCEASQDIPDVDYAALAELVGLKGIRIENQDQIKPALVEALSPERPIVLDILTDPNVPIVPPHMDMAQLAKFSKAMLKGDPEQTGIIRQTIREVMRGGGKVF